MSEQLFRDVLTSALTELYGVVGGAVSFSLLSLRGSAAVVRVDKRDADKVWAAAAFATRYGDHDVRLSAQRASASLLPLAVDSRAWAAELLGADYVSAAWDLSDSRQPHYGYDDSKDGRWALWSKTQSWDSADGGSSRASTSASASASGSGSGSASASALASSISVPYNGGPAPAVLAPAPAPARAAGASRPSPTRTMEDTGTVSVRDDGGSSGLGRWRGPGQRRRETRLGPASPTVDPFD